MVHMCNILHCTAVITFITFCIISYITMGVLLFVITSKFIIVHSHIMIIIRDRIVTHKKLEKNTKWIPKCSMKIL